MQMKRYEDMDEGSKRGALKESWLIMGRRVDVTWCFLSVGGERKEEIIQDMKVLNLS